MKGNRAYKGRGGMGKSLCNVFVLFCLVVVLFFSLFSSYVKKKKTASLCGDFFKVIVHLYIFFL